MDFSRLLTIVVLGLFGTFSLAHGETLQDAWAAAVAQNGQLAVAHLEEAAVEQELGAAKSQWWPSARAQASYTVRSDEQSFRFTNPLSPDQVFTSPYMQSQFGAAGVSLEMPLYTGGRVQNAVRNAQQRQTAANQGVATSRIDLLLAVSEAYLGVLRVQREMEVAQYNLAGLTAHEAEANQQHAQNRVPPHDLMAAQAATASAGQIVRATTYRKATTDAKYNRLLGRPLDGAVQIEELAFPKLPGEIGELQQLAVLERADLRQLEALYRARIYEAERLRSENRPQISAVGRFGYEENRFQTPQSISSAAVVLDWNFFDGARSRSLASAELNRAAGIGKLIDDQRSQIALEVLTAWNDREEAAWRVGVALQNLEQADENLRVLRLRFQQGLSVTSEVFDAQSQRAQAAWTYYAAQYDLIAAQVKLRHAIGILGP